ncbi:MAG: hypothetical protein L6408_02675 [Nanoarchaeota archaeon]|nr:hypothetical protein [Nanoarchaeota archaeon]
MKTYKVGNITIKETKDKDKYIVKGLDGIAPNSPEGDLEARIYSSSVGAFEMFQRASDLNTVKDMPDVYEGVIPGLHVLISDYSGTPLLYTADKIEEVK